jgi:uncharacterized repeat protein (TIGR03803 family)
MNARNLRTAAVLHIAALGVLVSPLLVSPAARAQGFQEWTIGSFVGTNGATSYSGLTPDGFEGMYGTTAQGGAHNDGTVFHAYTTVDHIVEIVTIATFNGANGSDPQGALVVDPSGDLWGTTAYGGAYNEGTVFEIPAGTDTIVPVISFDGSNGSYPFSGLTLDRSGNMYGTTGTGGAHGDGTVFRIAGGTHAFTSVASFNGTNGELPLSALTPDRNNDLYGTTYIGGANNEGTVYKIEAGTDTITTVATLHGSNGACPEGGVVFDGSGNLYGTAYSGGASDDGTIFKIAAGGSLLTTLATFDGSNGQNPRGGLAVDSHGDLFGATSGGGAQFETTYAAGMGAPEGEVYEIPAGGATIEGIVALETNLGEPEVPYAGVAFDASGNLWGTSAQGGTSNDGTVFCLF